MVCRYLFGLCLIVSLHLHATGSQAADVVAQIPDNALAYVVVNNLQEAGRSIEQVARELQLSEVDVLQMAKQQLNLTKGVANTRDMAFVLVGNGSAAPIPVLILPTDDYEDLCSELAPGQGVEPISRVRLADSDSLMGEKGAYAVFAPATAGEDFQQVLDSSGNVQHSAALNTFTDQAEICAVITEAGVKLFAQQAIGVLQMIKMRLSTVGPESESMAAGLAVYEELFKWSSKEVTQVALAINVDDDGSLVLRKRVALRSQIKLPEKGVTADLTKQLDDLPSWPFVVAFAGTIGDSASMQAWVDFSLDMMQGMYGSETLTDEQKAKLLAVTQKSLQGVSGMSFTMGVPVPGKSIYSRMGMIMTVENPEKYIINYSETLKEMQVIFGDSKGMPYRIVSAETIQVGGTKGLRAVMQTELIAFGPATAQSQQMFDKLLGDNGRIEFFAAPIDDHRVAFAYVSRQSLDEIIEKAKSSDAGLATTAELTDTAQLLSQDAQGVGYLSLEGVLQYAQQVTDLLMPGIPGAKAPQIPPFPPSPPLGFSIGYDDQALEAEMVAPAKTLQAMGEYIKIIKQKNSGESGPVGN